LVNGATTAQPGATVSTPVAERIAHWREWKRVCALGASSEATRAGLEGFAAQRFRSWSARYLERTNAGRLSNIGVSGRQAWHLFESHVTVKQTRQGKSYKQWLFARPRRPGDSELDVVQGGASLIMRDVVRNHLAAEFSPPQTVSMTAHVETTHAGSRTLEELLPDDSDPRAAISRRELSSLAREHAESLFTRMTRRERIALLAKQARISLAHPAVLDAAGCGKSSLHEAYRRATHRVHGRLTAAPTRDDPPSLLEMAGLCLRALIEQLSAWSARDKECQQLVGLLQELATL
jgi:hypothetical protein